MMNKFKVGDYVKVSNPHEEIKQCKGLSGNVIATNAEGECRLENYPYWFLEKELSLVNDEPQQSQEIGKFQQIANEAGAFTDMKNQQYGSSVDAAYEMMKILMERYTYDDENYLIPKSLLQHLLLQVRMMDKQNRIFNNPSGKGDSESPYKDLLGYSLIGVDMVERSKTDTK